MHESYQWKELLKEKVNTIERIASLVEIGDEDYETVDIELFTAMCILRKLEERNKLTTELCKKNWSIFSYPKKKGTRSIQFNDYDIDRFYSLDSKKKISKNLRFITNLFIHSSAISCFNGYNENEITSYLITSSYEHNKYLYEIPLDIICNLFKEASDNYPYTTRYKRIEVEDKHGNTVLKEVIING